MLRLLIFAVFMLLMSAICNGQGKTSFGDNAANDTSFTLAQLRLNAYAGSGDTTIMVLMPNGTVKKVAKNYFVTYQYLNDTLNSYQPLVNIIDFGADTSLLDNTPYIQAAINYLSGVRETFDSSTGNVTLDSIAPPKIGHSIHP